ncbi:MAG: hypothetical protein RL076_2378 [Chloroflexota bacterium]
MTRSRIPWLIFIAIICIVTGLVGAIVVTYKNDLTDASRIVRSLFKEVPLLNDNASKQYKLQEKITVITPATVRIIATGGDIEIRESIANQIALDFVVPYTPQKLDVAMMQRDGDTIVIDSKAIWTNLTGNVSQPVFAIHVAVPAGTTIEIRNTIGDITLDASLAHVTIDASLGDIDVRSTQIGHLDAQIAVSGSISGKAPASSNITLKTGDANLDVTQPGTHTIRTTTGDVTVQVDPTLIVALRHSVGNGDFTSELTTTATDTVNTYLYVSSETGDVTVTQAKN